MNPYVKSVKPQRDYLLSLTFENDEKRIFDVKPYLDKPVFRPLKNITLFNTARVVSGSVEWHGEVDLSYDTLYLGSRVTRENQARQRATHRDKKSLVLAPVSKKKPSKTRITAK